MIAIWSPDVLAQPGSPPTRGFGGRLYFYNEKNQAVPVEGQLVVYGYDDELAKERNDTPQRKFAFTPEQFTKHYSESDLGASYSVWLPWDAAGGDQQNVSLVPVFTSTSGKIVMGQQAINLLPGRVAQQPKSNSPTSLIAADAEANSGIQQASHQQATAGQPSADPNGIPAREKLRMRTSTIELTPSLRKRIAMARDEAAQLPTAAPPSNYLPAATSPYAQPVVTPGATTSAAMFPAAPGWGPPPTHFAPTTHPAPGAPIGPADPSGRVRPPFPQAPPFAPPSAALPGLGQRTGAIGPLAG